MKKVLALLVTTALCVSVFLPVRGTKSAAAGALVQNDHAPVLTGAEVQFGDHAVSDHVRNMPRGKDRGKHLSPDKDYHQGFNPDGLSRSGVLTDPVVQTSAAPNGSALVLTAGSQPDGAQPESPQPEATTQLIGNPGFENGSANPAPWTATAGVVDSSTSEPAHSGTWKAWMDGYGTTHTDTVQQT
ncbi:MAG: hypothetical protein ABR563_02825, partial [Pyrinomonadaceae bacterium]